MCDYSSIHLFKDFLEDFNKYFHVNTKEYPQLSSSLNLRIIQSPYGISIDQTAQTQDTILVQWFQYEYEKLNSYPTPFKADITFEPTLPETLPSNPSEIHLLEEL